MFACIFGAYGDVRSGGNEVPLAAGSLMGRSRAAMGPFRVHWANRIDVPDHPLLISAHLSALCFVFQSEQRWQWQERSEWR